MIWSVKTRKLCNNQKGRNFFKPKIKNMDDTRNDTIDNDNRNESKNINNIVRNDTNDNDIDNGNDNIKDINDIDSIDNDNESNSFTLTKEEILAEDLAAGLDDKPNFAFYLSAARKYPEDFLRKICSQVKEIPSGKIKKSKGALFNYLVHKYAKRGENNRN